MPVLEVPKMKVYVPQNELGSRFYSASIRNITDFNLRNTSI